MNPLHALILGLVEGLTEFLPISSTAHMELAARLLAVVQTDTVKSFEIVIQLGAIAAIVWLYGLKVLRNRQLAQRVIVAFIPTGILGLLFYKIVKKVLLGNTSVALWAMALGGIALIAFERWYAKRPAPVAVQNGAPQQLTYMQAFWIGCCQSLAMVPGVSRSAATIVGGLALGVSRAAIVEFSFLLAVPTIAAAAGLDLLKSAGAFSSADVTVLAIGFIAAFVAALATVKFLIKYVQTHTFTPFGVYRIAAALAFWGLVR